MNGLDRLLALGLVAFSVGCTHPSAHKAAQQNVVRIGGVTLNQTTDQVAKIMGKGPESSSQALLENGVREMTWYYLTDYDNETNTAITFRNGKVVAVNHQSAWLGNGTFVLPPK